MKLPNSNNIQCHENAVEFLLIVATQRLEREEIIHMQEKDKESKDNIEALKQAIITAEDFLEACHGDYEPFREEVHPLYTEHVEKLMAKAIDFQ